jgi:hypothetical protein
VFVAGQPALLDEVADLPVGHTDQSRGLSCIDSVLDLVENTGRRNFRISDCGSDVRCARDRGEFIDERERVDADHRAA